MITATWRDDDEDDDAYDEDHDDVNVHKDKIDKRRCDDDDEDDDDATTMISFMLFQLIKFKRRPEGQF